MRRCTIPLLLLSFSALAPLSARPKPKADDEACKTRFEELKSEYEAAREEGPEKFFPLLEKFGEAPCDVTVTYLRKLYQSDDNPGVHIGATRALGKIGSQKAIEVVCMEAAKHFEKDVFAMESVGKALSEELSDDAEGWFLKRGRLIPALRKYPEVWAVILQSMARFEHKDKVKALTEELQKGGTAESQVVILEALEGKPNRKVAAAAKRLLRSKEPEVQVAAMVCLWQQDAKKYKRDFERALKSKLWQARVTALRILTEMKDKKLGEHAKKLLDDPDVRVQLSAVRGLLRTGGRDSVEALIQRMITAEGRLLDDIADALARLTGKDLGSFSVSWESWWAANKDKKRNYAAISLAKYADMLGEKKAESKTLLYHGLRVLSSNVSFIVDTSESMLEKYIPLEERKKEEKKRTVVKGDQRVGPGEETRMKVAREELKKVLSSYQNGKYFDVVWFNSVVQGFILDALRKHQAKHLEKMTQAARAKATQFVDAIDPAGQTNLLEALQMAFAYPDCDTIYLLSDGAPSATDSDREPMETILEWLRRANRLRSVRINAIGFDLEAPEKEFLLRLTEENFGVFVER